MVCVGSSALLCGKGLHRPIPPPLGLGPSIAFPQGWSPNHAASVSDLLTRQMLKCFSRIRPPLAFGSGAAHPRRKPYALGSPCSEIPSWFSQSLAASSYSRAANRLDPLAFLAIRLAPRQPLQPPHLICVALDDLGPRSQTDALSEAYP
jgi:hypothetical protein